MYIVLRRNEISEFEYYIIMRDFKKSLGSNLQNNFVGESWKAIIRLEFIIYNREIENDVNLVDRKKH